MAKSQRKALSAHRRRLKQRGVARLELRVRRDDIPLLRALLRERFGAAHAKSFKEMLAAAPLDGIDLAR